MDCWKRQIRQCINRTGADVMPPAWISMSWRWSCDSAQPTGSSSSNRAWMAALFAVSKAISSSGRPVRTSSLIPGCALGFLLRPSHGIIAGFINVDIKVGSSSGWKLPPLNIVKFFRKFFRRQGTSMFSRSSWCVHPEYLPRQTGDFIVSTYGWCRSRQAIPNIRAAYRQYKCCSQ